MFSLLLALTASKRYAGLTFGCYGKGPVGGTCEDYKTYYEDPQTISEMQKKMGEITGDDEVIIEMNFETINSDEEAANFPSKVKWTSLSAILISFLPIKKENPLDLTKLETECFFTAIAFDLSSLTTVAVLDKEKLMKRTIKVLMAESMESNAKYTQKLADIIYKEKNSLSVLDTDLYIKAPAKCSKYVLMLLALAYNVSFVGNCEVNLYFSGPLPVKSDSGLIKSPYLITDLRSIEFNDLLQKSAPINDVAIYDSGLNINIINFLSDGWQIGHDLINLYNIKKSLVGGQLSIVVNVFHTKLETSGDYATVHDINISVSADYLYHEIKLLPSNMKSIHLYDITFTGEWQKVTNKPKIIVEALDPNSIDVYDQPNTVAVEKNRYKPKIEGKKKKLDIALIVGIVVGVVAFIAIVAGICIYFFVIRPRNKVQQK